MNQEKIGKFISKCRKNKGLTQEKLAESLGITYKAVSKWECGKGLPDASIMVDLCNILDISVNDLLCGEKINPNQFANKVDENLVSMKKNTEAIIASTKWGHIVTILLLLINVVLTAIKYGVEDAVSSSSYVIMTVSGVVFWYIYLYKMK